MKIDIEEQERERMPLERNFDRIISPLQSFLQSQSSAGMLLLIATFIALYMANSQWQEAYIWLTEYHVGFIWGEGYIIHSAVEWVNEGLIVLFFFLLGLEIKYQVLAGELQDTKSSMLAIFMAVGGMVIPALTYLAIMTLMAGDSWQGWGIPMATDTAFAIGLLVLLGRRVPTSVLVLITALAIVDDMGAVLIISFFYTDSVSLMQLGYGAITLSLMVLANFLGIRWAWFYLFAGLVLWWFISHSGVHATTAGILAALTVPAKPYADTHWFARNMERLVSRFKRMDNNDTTILEQQQQHDLAEAAEDIAITATTPVQRWQSKLSKPISLLVLPLFALLNAGVVMPDNSASMGSATVFWATMLGLLVGKPLGIFFFAYFAIKLGFAQKPKDMIWRDVIALGCFAGIGFTMSLFIANLAFSGSADSLAHAKLGILAGSLLSAVLGFCLFLSKSKSQLK
ncbi:Na+/H+ antiporter NhaA [Thalassotalea sp. 1_MG-2023]|uniref:Na+/H+ antiporter NhaA n=1 Tax=Thalassotalea sp. 1_MG-2023 TaxID=3062680 RepID=UPI0026E34A55|nr:Na+/H+ antiporter NhaA [Thalassotalea sp. 1_MG-2023]MDO6425565.1 Na+/H+ antiporter NhaA [Thalassotalea sp. 1_MG-2023]